MSKKTTFYYAIIKENVQLKVNSDLLEKCNSADELASKFLKTVNNNKKLVCMKILYKIGKPDEIYFCK